MRPTRRRAPAPQAAPWPTVWALSSTSIVPSIPRLMSTSPSTFIVPTAARRLMSSQPGLGGVRVGVSSDIEIDRSFALGSHSLSLR
jgi:hypothetical protein